MNTSLKHLSSCPACRDRFMLHIDDQPCLKHAAAARGMKVFGWKPVVVTAWNAKPAPPVVDPWAAWRVK